MGPASKNGMGHLGLGCGNDSHKIWVRTVFGEQSGVRTILQLVSPASFPNSVYGVGNEGSTSEPLVATLYRLEINIAKFDAVVVALQADVAGLAFQAGMAFEVFLVLVEVGIDDDRAIQLDGDMPAL